MTTDKKTVYDILAEKYPWWYLEYADPNCPPSDVDVNSKRVVTWQCLFCKRTWSTPIKNRVIYGTDGCLNCICEIHNLEITHPKIAKGFHKSKNGNLTAKNITVYANPNRPYWWTCQKCKHPFKATILDLIYNKIDCFQCQLILQRKIWRSKQKQEQESV